MKTALPHRQQHLSSRQGATRLVSEGISTHGFRACHEPQIRQFYARGRNRMAKSMLNTDEVALWYALHRFTTRYWFEVDLNGGGNAHAFYLPGALFAVGDNRFEGQEKIRAFYTKRRGRGALTARHVVSNLQVLPIDEHQVKLIGILSLYYAPGHPPHHGIHPPMLVADIAAECVLGADQDWRFQSHVLSPLFLGNALPISVSVDTGRL
jgi:hypothetical protein